MIPSAVLRVMEASGCSTAQIIAAVEASEASEHEKQAARRESDRLRKRRQRDRENAAKTNVASEMSRGQGVTVVTSVSPAPPPSPEKENPPPVPPLKKNKPHPLPTLFGGIEPVDNPVSAVSSKRALVDRGTAFSRDWVLPKAWGEWALREFPYLTRDAVVTIAAEFKDYWIGVPGQRGRKRDWEATWRNRVREKAARMRGTGERRMTLAEQTGENLRREIEELQRDKNRDGGEEGRDFRIAPRLLAVGREAR